MSTKKTNELESSFNNFYSFLKVSTKIATTITGSVLMIFAILHIYVPLIFFSYFFWADALLIIISSSIILFLAIIVLRRKIINWRDQVINIFICIGYSFLNEWIFLITRPVYAFTILGAFIWAFQIALTGVFIMSCINLVIYAILMLNSGLVPSIRKRLKERILFNLPNKKELIVLSLLFFGIIGIPTLILFPPTTWNAEITIQPKDYQAKIAFWGRWHNESYTQQQKESLNDHSVLIHGYGWDIGTEREKAFIDNITHWRNNYPNVKFSIAVAGIHNDFVSDIHTAEVINKTKTLVGLVKDNSLSNVVGVSYDVEESYFRELLESEGISTAPNRERHEESRLLWLQFFEWMEVNASDMKIYLVNYVESAIDLFDGDNDIQLMRKYNAHEVPFWDKYVPMIYRGVFLGPLPYGEYPYPSFFNLPPDQAWIYYQMDYLYKGLEQQYSSTDRMGVLLGVTNLTCYGRDVVQEVRDGEIMYGYDKLVEDSLMAKHFGVETITLFLLNTVVQDGFAMGGVFATYGDDFLDKFNESINGVNSTKSFTIRHQGPFYWNYFGVFPFFQDALLDLDSILGILYFALVIGLNITIVFYEEIKEKIKNLKKNSRKS